jgi:Protein of unknown function (DUF3460)
MRISHERLKCVETTFKEHTMLIKGSGYESDHTKFIRELKEKMPHLEADQLKGRALLWDKAPINLDETARAAVANVPHKAYPYQTKV